jgi:hypothetical protein
LIALLLLADWTYGWWITNLLQNNLEAKRRLRRGRDPDIKP